MTSADFWELFGMIRYRFGSEGWGKTRKMLQFYLCASDLSQNCLRGLRPSTPPTLYKSYYPESYMSCNTVSRTAMRGIPSKGLTRWF